eukprot:6439130-Alexandrium_andersonii.AAC.1
MSASLVGSEMCIRDRSCASEQSTHGDVQALVCAVNRLCKDVLRSLDAVSYTHLTLPTICSV